MSYMEIRAAFAALMEGGGSIPGADPVERDGCVEIVSRIGSALRSAGWECVPAGSAGKAAVSSDVDILVRGDRDSDGDRLAEWVCSEYSLEPDEVSRAGGQLHFGYGYGSSTVQVDLELVPDLEMGAFFRHSPSPGESEWSGAHRTAFLCRLARIRPLDPGLYPTTVFSEGDGVPSRYEGTEKEFWTLSLMPRGLYARRRSWAGVRKPRVKTPRVTEERLITRNPSEAAEAVLGKGAKPSDCDSLESLMDWVLSGNWRFGGAEELSSAVHDMCFGDLVYGDGTDPSERRRLFSWFRSRMRDAGTDYVAQSSLDK